MLCYPVDVSWQSTNQTPPSSPPQRAPAAAELSIGEVCARTGLSPRTVRYYEELGLLPGVRRRAGARRVYGDDELERLRFIQRLKAFGLTLNEIKDLNSLYALAGSTRTMLERLAVLLDSHLEGLDARIAELVGLRDEMTRYRERVAGRIADDTASADAPPDASSDSDEGGST